MGRADGPRGLEVTKTNANSAANHHLKREATSIYNKARRLGELTPPETCERCGVKPELWVSGHHDDYAKPLDVMWLCQGCHSRRHTELGEIKIYGAIQPGLLERWGLARVRS